MNTLQHTFNKHLKLLREHLALKEYDDDEEFSMSSYAAQRAKEIKAQPANRAKIEAEVKDKIDDYKKERRRWELAAKGEYERWISNGKIDDDVYVEYYRGWEIKDLQAVYRALEGEDYKPGDN
jgi:hypothetical protein